MNYQINYGLSGDANRVTTQKIWLKYTALALLTLGLCLAVVWSFGGDWAVTVGALEDMAQELVQGQDLKEAFSSFCIDFLQGAQCG